MTEKRARKIIIAIPALWAAMATTAQAHPGEHNGVASLTDAVLHFVGSPFHLTLLAGAFGTAGIAACYALRKFRATRI